MKGNMELSKRELEIVIAGLTAVYLDQVKEVHRLAEDTGSKAYETICKKEWETEKLLEKVKGEYERAR